VRSTGKELRSEVEEGYDYPKERGERLPPSSWKGQASVEFLIMSFFSLATLTMAVLVYSQEWEGLADARSTSLMRSICTSLSARISGLAVAGPGADVRLDYPDTIYGNNYTIWVQGNDSIIKVIRYRPEGGLSSVGCYMKTRLVSDGSSDGFAAVANGTVRNVDGVVVFGE
jgi:hypothetical protein